MQPAGSPGRAHGCCCCCIAVACRRRTLQLLRPPQRRCRRRGGERLFAAVFLAAAHHRPEGRRSAEEEAERGAGARRGASRDTARGTARPCRSRQGQRQLGAGISGLVPRRRLRGARPAGARVPQPGGLPPELRGDGEAVQGARVPGRGAADPARGALQEHLHHRGPLHRAAGAHVPRQRRRRRRPDVGPRARPRLLPPLQRLPDGAVRVRAALPRPRPAPRPRRRLRPRRRRPPPLLEPLLRRRPLHALLPRLGSGGVERGPGAVRQRHPRALQRQHLGGLPAGEGREHPGDQPLRRRHAAAASVASAGAGRTALPGLLRRRAARPRPGPPPPGMERPRPGHLPGVRVRPPHHHRRRRRRRRQAARLLLLHAAGALLPLPERARGGEPARGGGHPRRVRPRARVGRLRAALRRRAPMGGVLGVRAGRRYPEAQGGAGEHTGGGGGAAPGWGPAREAALHAAPAAGAAGHVPHDPALCLAQEAQLQTQPPQFLTVQEVHPKAWLVEID